MFEMCCGFDWMHLQVCNILAQFAMEDETNLPFKVGDLAEARSFQKGFRGAWFRCKIIEITKRKGRTQHLLEYYDFPDDKPRQTQLYQIARHLGKSKDKDKKLMLRPRYPPIYNENQMPNVNEISEVAVIINDAWKVGDLVDWFTTGCYWSGKITHLLGDGKAKMDLNPAPLGEGASYDILLKDIRPSLDWSPGSGWTMRTREGDAGCPSARLIKSLNQVSSNSPSSDETKNRGRGNSGTKKKSLADTDSRQTSAETVAADDQTSSSPLKKIKASEERTSLHSEHSDTLEAAILDLEEYLNKVKWLKGILESGISSTDTSKSQWEFADANANADSATRK